MDLGWDVRVSVEHEACSVSVGTHVLKDQPIANFSSLKLSVIESAYLVQTVTGRSENGGRNLFRRLVATVLIKGGVKCEWNRVIVVVDYVIERAVHSVVNVKGLGLSLTAFSSVNFCRDCGRPTYEITAWLSNKAELTRIFKLFSKHIN